MTSLLQNGVALAKAGKWVPSATNLAEALRHPAFDWETDRNVVSGGRLELLMAMAFVKANDHAGHEQTCRFLLNFWDSGYRASSVDIERFVRACFLSKDGLPTDLQKRGFELARRAETNDLSHPFPHLMALSVGIAEYRAGEYARSLELLQTIGPAKDRWGPRITCRGESLTFQAMALKRLGREPEARAILSLAREQLSEPISSRSGAAWEDLELCQMALDEAQELFGESLQR